MAYNRNQARAICNKSEYELFVSSLKGEIEKLPQKRVQSGIKRSRTLRDKYRDLFKRQRLDTRERTGTKKGVRANTNARTEQKARLFEEVLGRFEARLKALKSEASAATSKSSAKPAAGRKKSSGKKTPAKKVTGKKTTSRKAPKKKTAKKKTAKKKAAKKKASKKKTGRKKVSPGAGTETFQSGKAAAASKRQQAGNIRSRAVMGHTKASTKRRQAKRDGGKKR